MTQDVQARLAALAAQDGRAPAIHAPDRESMTRGVLRAHIDRVRETFGRWGIARGDIVLAPVFDRPTAMTLYASAPASATLGLLSNSLTAEAYATLIERTHARAVLVPQSDDHALAAAARALGVARIAVTSDATIAGACTLDLIDEGTTSVGDRNARSRAWAYLHVTSGTTARPKLVPYGHRQLLAVADALGALLEVGPADVSAVVAPLHLANGQRTALGMPLLRGASSLCLPEADVDALLAAIRDDRIGFVSASYAVLRALLERIGPRGRVRSSRLRFVRIASGALDPPEIEALERALGVPAVVGLASTETGVVTHQALPPAPRTAGSIGWPMLAELRVVDDGGHEVAVGAAGEVQVRGPQLFDGYLDDDELERGSRADGWFRIGDLARIDPSGEIFLLGRKTEVVNRGGDKIAPLEVDAALRSIDGVADAAAFGVPHPTLGEEIVAAVVPVAGVRLDADSIAAIARARLGANRAPRRIWIVESLPRNDAGKVLRRALPTWVGFEPAGANRSHADVVADAFSPIQAALAGMWGAIGGDPVSDREARWSSVGAADPSGALLAMQVQTLFDAVIDTGALIDGDPTLAEMAARIERARTQV